MSQKRCLFNVFKCPTTIGLKCGELLGSFKNEDKAKKRVKEESSKIDKDKFVVFVHKFEYEA